MTLISGTTVAQAINVVSIPFLSRLYSPSDFGSLGIYMAAAAILISVSTLQFHKAIILPKDLSDSKTLSILSISCVGILSVLTCIFFFLFGELILIRFNQVGIYNWIVFIPLTIICVGIREVLFVWFNKRKEYKVIANSRVIIALTTSIISISLGYLIKDYSLGLLLGLLSGQFVGSMFLCYFSFKEIFNQALKLSELKRVAIQYSNFPKFTLPSELMNVFINQVPVFGLSSVIGQMAVGYYNMSNKVLGLPISLIGGAISEVFKQKTSEEVNINGNCRRTYIKTLKAMVSISVFPFLFLMFFGPQIFSFVLGEKWYVAGQYAQVLAPLFLFRFFASPLSFMYHLFSKQAEEFLLHCYFLISTLLIFYLFLEHGAIYTLTIFSINYVCVYIYVLIRGYMFSMNKVDEKSI